MQVISLQVLTPTLTGMLRIKYIMDKMPGIPLSPQNQNRVCSRAPKASLAAQHIFPELSPSPLHTQSLPRCVCPSCILQGPIQMSPPRTASLIFHSGEGSWSTWLRLLQGDFTLRLPWGWPVGAPGGTDGKVLGSLDPGTEEMQREYVWEC